MATQAQIDEAKQKMDNAKSAFDSAKSTMSSWYGRATECCYKDGTLALGELSDVTCKKCFNCNDHPGCCSKETCQSVMASYNGSVTAHDNAELDYESAKEIYDELVSDGVGSNGNGDNGNGFGNFDKSKITKWVIFGVIALVIIIGGIFLIKYIFRRR